MVWWFDEGGIFVSWLCSYENTKKSYLSIFTATLNLVVFTLNKCAKIVFSIVTKSYCIYDIIHSNTIFLDNTSIVTKLLRP